MGRIVDPSQAKLATGLVGGASANDAGLLLMAIAGAEGAIRRFLGYDPVYATRVEYYPIRDAGQMGRETLWEISPTMAYERRVAQGSADALIVRHLPIRSITELKIDYDGRAGTRSGSFGSETVKTEGTDFWPNYDMVDSDGARVCNDGVIRSQGRWPDVAGSIKLTYYAGYKPRELNGQDTLIDASPIWSACLMEIQRRMIKLSQLQKRTGAGFSGPLTSENLGDYSYTSDSALLGIMVGGSNLLPESMDQLSPFVNYGWALA